MVFADINAMDILIFLAILALILFILGYARHR